MSQPEEHLFARDCIGHRMLSADSGPGNGWSEADSGLQTEAGNTGWPAHDDFGSHLRDFERRRNQQAEHRAKALQAAGTGGPIEHTAGFD